MSVPSLPSNYDVSKHVGTGRSDCHLTVGFDQQRRHIPRFIVILHYRPLGQTNWEAIARMDHNETSTLGHDVYREGLHVDIDRQSSPEVHLKLKHGSLPASRGEVIRRCGEYFAREIDYFIDVYEENHSPGSPPRWPDGGGLPPEWYLNGAGSAPTLFTENPVETSMSSESTEDEPEILSLEELSEVLAEAEGTTAEEIERGARDIEIAPPSEATVVDE
jgi:hypothetical protein